MSIVEKETALVGLRTQVMEVQRLSKSLKGFVFGRSAKNGIITHVDQIGSNFVRGWAVARARPNDALWLRLYLDDKLCAEGHADIQRDDLRMAGYGGGSHAYQFPVPAKALFCANRLSLTMIDSMDETTILSMQLQNAESRTTQALYFDASDLIEFLTNYRELSGIQRVQAGYLLNIGSTEIDSTLCKICARFSSSNFFWDIPFEDFSAILRQAEDISAIPDKAWSDHILAFKNRLTTRSLFQQGDTLFTMGAPWALDGHTDLIQCLKVKYGISYLQIFYDMIPITLPEVVAPPLIPPFARSMACLSHYAEHVFCISRYSMDDLAATLVKVGRHAPESSVIPMGGSINDAERGVSQEVGVLDELGVDVPFVLCVGTLEPRKNHMLLFQVWRRLVAKHGAPNVPKLVLVGRVGWYMEDFIRILKVTNYVENTIIHLKGVTNSALSELYGKCLFTVFPSFSEGWGLPITESHARGKVCVCSNVTSMPEAGGDRAIYIDPYDTSAALAVCEDLIFDGHSLAERETMLQAAYKQLTWSEASAGLRDQLSRIINRPSKPGSKIKPLAFKSLYQFSKEAIIKSDALAIDVLKNSLDQEDAIELLSGWHWFDIDVQCVWACGPTAELRFLPPADTPDNLIAYLDVMAAPQYSDVPCAISIDGRQITRFTIRDKKRLAVPITGVKSGQIVSLTFTYVEPRAPRGQDLRYLGIGIQSLAVYPHDDYTGRLEFWEASL